MLGASTPTDLAGTCSLERERAELWRWVHQLERFAELGIHSRGLVHDLGNTLTSLLAGLELALLKKDETALRRSIAQSLDIARVAAERLHAHVDFTRRARRQEPPLALASALEDALRIIAHPLRKSAAHIQRNVDEAVCATGSHPQVVQVVVNALLAVLASLRGVAPTLDVRIAVEGNQAVLEIRGRDGEGPDDPLSSSSGAASRTGLELEVARRVVAAYGGSLEVPPEGGRSHARLTLPSAGAATQPEAAGAGEALATWRPTSSWPSPPARSRSRA